MNIFSTIWAWIMSILMLIFPNIQPYEPPLDWEAATQVVLEAIETRDIDAIEALMCKNIKDNYPNLHDDIGAFIDTIEGEIVSMTKSPANGSGTYTNKGKIDRRLSVWYIETTTTRYCLSINWEISNSYSFEERGIRLLGLTVPTENDSTGVALIMEK